MLRQVKVDLNPKKENEKSFSNSIFIDECKFYKKKMEFSSTKIIIRAKIMLYKNRDKISVEETNNALFTRQIDILCVLYIQAT